MDKELFESLEQGIKEMIAYEKGNQEVIKNTDTTVIKPRFSTNAVDSPIQENGAAYITSVRYDLEMSQVDFARLLGVSTMTVTSWEQGLRKPNGSVTKLITLIDNDPSRINELIEL